MHFICFPFFVIISTVSSIHKSPLLLQYAGKGVPREADALQRPHFWFYALSAVSIGLSQEVDAAILHVLASQTFAIRPFPVTPWEDSCFLVT